MDHQSQQTPRYYDDYGLGVAEVMESGPRAPQFAEVTFDETAQPKKPAPLSMQKYRKNIENRTNGDVVMYDPAREGTGPSYESEPEIYGQSDIEIESRSRGNVKLYKLEDRERAYLEDRPQFAHSQDASPAEVAPVSGKNAVPSAEKGPAVVYFGHGDVIPAGPDIDVLRRFARNYQESRRYMPVFIEGHASKRAAVSDAGQRAMVNMKTSLKRALNTMRVLVEEGVPAEFITVNGYGHTRPASSETKSRRVEVYARYGGIA